MKRGADPEIDAVELELPASACDGHFPGRPLVPGVVQLVAVAATIGQVADRGGSSTVAAIQRVRFRRPVVPGDRPRLTASHTGHDWRFAVSVRDVVVTEGRLVLGHTAPWRGAAGEPSPIRSDLPPMTAVLPHREPMLLVEGVMEFGGEGGTCLGRVGPDAPLVMNGEVPAVALVEVAAQSLAVLEGVRRGFQASSPAVGYLVGISDAVMMRRSVPVGAAVIASVRRSAVVPPLVQAEASVSLGPDEVLQCKLAAWVESDAGS
jgi:3-hydroxymyristoyl/3-hydroxydecanoyl-(acyl carrier protein) dehydratase